MQFSVFTAVAALAGLAMVGAAPTDPPHDAGRYPCNAIVPGNGIYSFEKFKVECNTRPTNGTSIGSSTQPTEPDCLKYCNNIKYCQAVSYRASTGECTQYGSTGPFSTCTDNDFDFLVLSSYN